MKNWTKRMLCLVLLACMLLQTGALAAESPTGPVDQATEPVETQPETTEPTVTEPALTEPEATEPETTEPETTEPEATEPEATEPEPDPLEGYTFPNNWAREALKFAVRNGILQGRFNKDLDPKGNTTRAEMGAMLVRLLGASEGGDLSQYEDVNPRAWYCTEMGTAVSMGIFNGVSSSELAPNRYITRQEAFTVLARAFGLYPREPEAYAKYTDAGKINYYARNSISALTELGCASGYPDGTLRPKDPITRQEVAALFYKLLDQICDDPAQLQDTGFVLYRGSQPLPEGFRLDGSLILGAGFTGTQQVAGLCVTERLIARCATHTELTLAGCQAQELSIASAMTVRSDSEYPLVTSSGAGSVVELGAEQMEIYAAGEFSGDYETAHVHCDGVVLGGSGGQVVFSAAQSRLTVEGSADSVVLEGNESILTGSGYAGTVTVRGRNCTVELKHGTLEDQVDWGLEGLKATITGTESISSSNPKVSLTATFTNFKAGYGCENGTRVCTVRWYEGSVQISEDTNFILREGSTSTCTKTYDTGTSLPANPVFTVEITCGSEKVRAQFTVKVDRKDWDYESALQTVKGVNIEAETLCSTTLYRDKGMTQAIRTLPKGTALTHLYYSGAEGAPGQVRTSDGTVGWVDWDDYLVSRTNYTQFWDYSDATKEGFVDQMGYSSNTSYLIWTSLKTQKVNIFKGSKGNWTLIRTCSCATGKNTTPTVTGVFSVIYKTERWRFSETVNGKYVDDYTRVYDVTGFWGGQAFHSRLYYSADDSLCDGTMGTPVSHGCIRMMDEDCAYIYNSIPYDTTVVIF